MTALLLALIMGLADPVDAEAAYSSGRFADALDMYDTVLAEGRHRNDAVLFNMGNCAFRLGRFAEAALYYRRSLLRMPGDGEAAFNLALAEQRLGMDTRPDDSFGSSTLKWIDALSPLELLLLAAGLETLGLVGLVLFRRRPMLRLAMAIVILLSLAGAVRLVHSLWLDDAVEGVVTAREITLQAGERVRVMEMSDRWMRVEQAEGSGWTERAGVGLVE